MKITSSSFPFRKSTSLSCQPMKIPSFPLSVHTKFSKRTQSPVDYHSFAHRSELLFPSFPLSVHETYEKYFSLRLTTILLFTDPSSSFLHSLVCSQNLRNVLQSPVDYHSFVHRHELFLPSFSLSVHTKLTRSTSVSGWLSFFCTPT